MPLFYFLSTNRAVTYLSPIALSSILLNHFYSQLLIKVCLIDFCFAVISVIELELNLYCLSYYMAYFDHKNPQQKWWHLNLYKIFTMTPWIWSDPPNPITSLTLSLHHPYAHTFLYFMPIESNSWYCILLKCAISDCFYQGRLASILKPNYCNFKLFIKEFRFNPIKNFVKEGEHINFYLLSNLL